MENIVHQDGIVEVVGSKKPFKVFKGDRLCSFKTLESALRSSKYRDESTRQEVLERKAFLSKFLGVSV